MTGQERPQTVVESSTRPVNSSSIYWELRPEASRVEPIERDDSSGLEIPVHYKITNILWKLLEIAAADPDTWLICSRLENH